jgi:hypothetical protein
MRIDRGYLFWGIFFVLLGAIPLADREGWIEVGGLGDAWRLWPLIIIGLGIVILFSRTRLALAASVVAALVLGGLAGTALASFGGDLDCGRAGRADLDASTANGTLTAPASLDVKIDCGTLALGAGPGDGWTLDARHSGGPPRVESGADRLTIRPAEGGLRRQEWTLAVPAAALDSVRVEANAASTTLDLGTATLSNLRTTLNAGEMRLTAPTGGVGRLEADVNAGDLTVIASGSDIATLDLDVNAGSAHLDLGGSVTGSARVSAGSLEICVPPTADLRIETGNDVAFTIDVEGEGLTRSGDAWVREGTGPRIDLAVHGTVGTFTLDPPGGCR